MNKIRVIDLLNKIANGEKVPERIKFHYNNYEFNRDTYCIDNSYYEIETGTEWLDSTDFGLNDEIEIIEEPKKIENITWKEKESLAGIETQKTKMEILARRTEKIKKSLNEIIDYINSKED